MSNLSLPEDVISFLDEIADSDVIDLRDLVDRVGSDLASLRSFLEQHSTIDAFAVNQLLSAIEHPENCTIDLRAAENSWASPPKALRATPLIAIDFGTSNSVVSVMEGGEAKVIPNAEGNRLTPSVVAFTSEGEILVGEPARRQAITNPTRTVFSIKRFMGRRNNEVGPKEKMVPYKVIGDADEYLRVEIGEKNYTPQEICARILRNLKDAAESYLGQQVSKAVITVPAYFNDAQRQATKDAGKIAGLEIAQLINEPTAAAMAYGLDKKRNEHIVVFDLGGGTCDVSVLEVTGAWGETSEGRVFEVKSTSGDTHLGGVDFDKKLIHYVVDEFKNSEGIDLRNDAMALQRLHEACEKAKVELSSVAQTDINLPFIIADSSGPKHLQLTVTRAKFEALIRDLVERCRMLVEQALSYAQLSPTDIGEVVLVGGSTRVPLVQQIVQEIFGKASHQGVNPVEVVALGAAIQASVLAGNIEDVLLLDVTPLSLGIETEGGVLTALVERNTTIPAEKKIVFSTAADNQSAVTVSVYQGERPMAADNRLLGQFNLEGIPPAPRGMPQIEVSFDIDQNGILNVSAKDLGTGKQAQQKIEQSSALDDAEISRMKKDAESHAAEDKKRVELANLRNQADQMSYQLEKLIKEHEDSLNANDKKPLTKAIDTAREAAKSDDIDRIKAAVEVLDQASHAFSKKVAERVTPAKDSAAEASESASTAEFEVRDS